MWGHGCKTVYFESDRSDSLSYLELVIRTVKDCRLKPARKKALTGNQKNDIQLSFKKEPGSLTKEVVEMEAIENEQSLDQSEDDDDKS